MALIQGSPGPDDLSSDVPGDVIEGLGGKDTLAANADGITLDGGEGDDQLFSFVGGATLIGGPGDDLLYSMGTNDTASYSFTLNKEPGEAGEAAKFTEWLSDKYGKDFGDELPDFERGHHHHHGKHHHHDHGKHHHHHAKHDHDHSHHHKHGGCDDHQPPQWGLSQEFFYKNYGQWLKEVVVADLLAQGLVHDANGNGKIDIKLNANDPNGTPWIEGFDGDLTSILGDRDEVTLRHHLHGHDKWYSNSYTSSSSEGETTVSSSDGNDTIFMFTNGDDILRFDFTADAGWNAGMDKAEEELAFLQSFFSVTAVDADSVPGNESTKISVGDWSTTLFGQLYDDADNNGSNDVFDHIAFFVNDMPINDTLIG